MGNIIVKLDAGDMVQTVVKVDADDIEEDENYDETSE